MASAGFLIYSGIMPLIKTFLAIFFGYVLSRKGLFPPAASQGASQVTMNISLPALIFSNIVPAFTPSNVSAIGPLFLVAFIYMGVGFLMGLIIREVCYVPRNFWQGIIIITGMSNWGNLPNAVVLSVTKQAPFDPDTDPALGVSFVSIFIVAYHLVFWVGGAAHSLSWDYVSGIPQGADAERRVSWKQKPIGMLVAKYILRQQVHDPFADVAKTARASSEEKDGEQEDIEKTAVSVAGPSRFVEDDSRLEVDPDIQLARRTSRVSAISALSSRHPYPLVSVPAPSPVPTVSAATLPIHSSSSTISDSLNHLPRRMTRVFKSLAVVITPVTLTLAVSLPIALIQPLKALFVDVSASGGPDWHGPDGQPPLAFMIDTADFLGAIAVPMALVLLGAAFARLRIPRPISRLPIAAMLAVSVSKMLLLPVIGVFMVQGLVRSGLISKDAKAERFVAMFLSGTPAAVNQLIVAALYAPDGNVETLSAFLLVQYAFMFFSSAALTAVSLLLL